MLPTDTRCFVRHAHGVFHPDALGAARNHFLEREEQGWNVAANDRERTRLAIGAAPDRFRLDERWYDLWRTVDERVVDYFRPYTWVVYPVHIRHVTATAHLVPWHQDAAYIALMPRRHDRVITCFVPLEPEPTAGSTLELAQGEFPLLSHEPAGNHGAAIRQCNFPEAARYDLSFGDAIIFGDHVPHRTVPAANGLINRRSFEFRMVLPAEALPEKDYFDLETRTYVRRVN